MPIGDAFVVPSWWAPLTPSMAYGMWWRGRQLSWVRFLVVQRNRMLKPCVLMCFETLSFAIHDVVHRCNIHSRAWWDRFLEVIEVLACMRCMYANICASTACNPLQCYTVRSHALSCAYEAVHTCVLIGLFTIVFASVLACLPMILCHVCGTPRQCACQY